jgi:hypothetical protein
MEFISKIFIFKSDRIDNISFANCLIKKCKNLIFRLLSKSDENVFQSMVNTTNKTIDHHQVHLSQESSTSAIGDVNLRFFLFFEKSFYGI